MPFTDDIQVNDIDVYARSLAFHDLNIDDSTFYGSYIIFDVFIVNI